MSKSKLKYITRNESNPKGKSRVYFTCHPSDFESSFDMIISEILNKQNCAIYYYTPTEKIDDDELVLDLSEMQLLVVPVTEKLLLTENRALDFDFKFALEHHIPILPIMLEKNLEKLFNEKCGDLQFLDKFENDPTAISYDEKMEKILNSTLISDELAEKIRDAFDAYIFLSYRKKDRRYAQDLMRLIHKNDFCRDIAIWYDEFLVPGENFNDAIADAMRKSKLFTMVVTPNLVNEENYVMTIEYPMARDNRMLILPAEAIKTDKEELKNKYKDIPECTSTQDEKALSDSLLNALKTLAIESNDSSPEHNFFIGLAYLSGIDVEVNYEKALKLITSAAEDGLIEAKEKLVSMYENGIGVKKDCYEAIKWQYRVAEYYYENYYSNSSQIELENLIAVNHNLANLCLDGNILDDAEEHFNTILELCEELKEYNEDAVDINLIDALNGLYRVCVKLGRYSEAGQHISSLLELFEKNDACDPFRKSLYYSNAGLAFYFAQDSEKAMEYYDKSNEFLSKTEERDIDYLIMGTRLHINIGTLMYSLKRYEEAIQNYSKAIEYSEKVNNLTKNKYIDDLFDCYNSIGMVYLSMEEFDKAHEVLKKLFDKIYKEFKEERNITWIPYEANLQNTIGQLFWHKKEYENAEKHYKKATNLYKKFNFMQINPYDADLAMVYNNLGVLYADSEDCVKAIEEYEKASGRYLDLSKKEKKYRENYALIKLNTSICQFKSKAFAEAENSAIKAYEIYKEMYLEGMIQFANEVKKAARQVLETSFKCRHFIKGIKLYYEAMSLIKNI